MFKGSFDGVSREFQGCLKVDWMVFWGSFKEVSIKFKGVFPEYFKEIEKNRKGVLSVSNDVSRLLRQFCLKQI